VVVLGNGQPVGGIVLAASLDTPGVPPAAHPVVAILRGVAQRVAEQDEAVG
jgi:hypothetical protein